MSILEIRRHSLRGAGDHLSQEGIILAQRIGAEMGPFSLVVTSHLTRAIETACAMGFAVDETNPNLAILPGEVLAEADWQGGYSEFARAMKHPGATQNFGNQLRSICQSILKDLSENQQALIISHGGLIEAATVACAGFENVDSWNFSAGNCEGVRLRYREGRFVDPQPLRLNR